MSLEELLYPQRVRQRLGLLDSTPISSYGRLPKSLRQGLALSPAGVLIPLTEVDGQMEVVFTKRPETMAQHSGEVSFPGGRAEEDDKDLLATALRETREEISLLEEHVHPFGALVQLPTITGYDITAFVGEFLQPYELVPAPDEIDVLFQAPLVELANESNHRVEKKSWSGVEFEIHYYSYEDFTIWGATGHMLHELLRFLKEP